MIPPQEAAAVVKEIPGLAKAIETSGILLSVVIFCVLIFMIVKLVVTTKVKGKAEGKSNGLNPGYVAQVQNHMADAIAANTKIDSVDQKTDKLCECMVLLSNNLTTATGILGKISDSQIKVEAKLYSKKSS